MKTKFQNFWIVYLILNILYAFFDTALAIIQRISIYNDSLINSSLYRNYSMFLISENYLIYKLIFPLKSIVIHLFDTNFPLSSQFLQQFYVYTANAHYLSAAFPDKAIEEFEPYLVKLFQLLTQNLMLSEFFTSLTLIIITVFLCYFFLKYMNNGVLQVQESMQKYLKIVFTVLISYALFIKLFDFAYFIHLNKTFSEIVFLIDPLKPVTEFTFIHSFPFLQMINVDTLSFLFPTMPVILYLLYVLIKKSIVEYVTLKEDQDLTI